MLRSLQAARTESPNEVLKHAVDLMNANLFFAASCVLKMLHGSLSDADRPKTAALLAQCGLALGSHELMQHAKEGAALGAQMRNVIGFVQEKELHQHMLRLCEEDCRSLPEAHAPSPAGDFCVAICAGGPKLMLQLWANLHSLVGTGFEGVDVVIVHADEIGEAEVDAFGREFGRSLRLRFLDVGACAELVRRVGGGAGALRGYQIKMAAMCVLNYGRVLLCDADILWLRNPLETIPRDRDLFVFSDIWHFRAKRHDKSSTTSFLYRLHGVDSDVQEFESGVVYLDRAAAPGVVRMLFHMCVHHKYYFNLAFGDKDLYYLAARRRGASVRLCPRLPMMLGTVADGEFTSQSMVQSVEAGPSHVHTTLHPIGDENAATPTHICRESDDIHFVERTIAGKRVGTVACDLDRCDALDAVTIYSCAYASAFACAKTFSASAPEGGP
jgi:hypothetical protein